VPPLPEKKFDGPEKTPERLQPVKQLSFLVPVFSELFLPLMRRDFLSFSFFSAGHVGTPYP